MKNKTVILSDTGEIPPGLILYGVKVWLFKFDPSVGSAAREGVRIAGFQVGTLLAIYWSRRKPN